MAKKNKNNLRIKKQKQKEEQLLNIDETELVNKGDDFLADGNIRRAIQLYQKAIKLQQDESLKESVKLKLFRAYIERSKELKEKNMLSEAKVIEKQAVQLSLNPSILDVSDTAFLLKISSDETAFYYYNTFYNNNGDSAYLDSIAAEILISRRCWDNMNLINDETAVKKGALLVKPALELMDSGEWDSALELMKNIPRSSPFAPVKLFCKAVSAFYNNDNSAVLKAAAMIPPDSMFSRIAESLKYNFTQNNLNQNHDISKLQQNINILRYLWSGPFDIYQKADDILKYSQKNNYNNYLQNSISDFASLLMPEDREPLIHFILETLFDSKINLKNSSKFLDMAYKLSKNSAKLLDVKIPFFFEEESLENLSAYFNNIDKEFSDLQEQKIAKAALIYIFVLNIFKHADYQPILIRKHNILSQFGIDPSLPYYPRMLQMLLSANKIDPENKDIYDLTLKLPLNDKTISLKLKEQIFLSQCSAFPNDPESYLNLSAIYYLKNAYRKAEAALQKALELAPHDKKVIEQHFISLLISAEKSAGKNKFNLALEAVEKAKQLGLKQYDILIEEKSIVYKIMETSLIDVKEIETLFNKFPLLEKLRCYTLLILDINDKFNEKNIVDINKKLKLITNLFNVELKRLDELTSWDILNLLLPLPEEWEHLFKRREVIVNFVEKFGVRGFSLNIETAVLDKLENNDLLILINNVGHKKVFPILLKQIKKRIKAVIAYKYCSSDKTDKSDKSDMPDRIHKHDKSNSVKDKMNISADRDVLEFYSIVLDDIINSSYSAYEYLDLIETADDNTKEKLKQASRKLAPKASGILHKALDQFDFYIEQFYNFSFDDFGEEDDDDDDEDESSYLEELFKFFNADADSDGKNKGKNKKSDFDPFSLINNLSSESDEVDKDKHAMVDIFKKEIRKVIKTPQGRAIKEDIESMMEILENIIDSNNLRGKSEQELRKIKKQIIEKNECGLEVVLINLVYKKEAQARFSKEAQILFIE